MIEELKEHLDMGDWWEISHVFEKRHDYGKTIWRASKLKQPVFMMFVGYRTVQEGVSFYDEQFGNYGFKTSERIKVLLFVETVNKNPVYVLPKHIGDLNIRDKIEGET